MPRTKLRLCLGKLDAAFAESRMAMQDLAFLARRKKGMGTPCRGAGSCSRTQSETKKHCMLCRLLFRAAWGSDLRVGNVKEIPLKDPGES